ncbi:MAG: PQQ-binding-like beta-propeller repeat protein [Anaerolineales bacterium]|nr:MAG: PQQ-binding-like beta-propeller repeat protein [Anaerolineales bacterium]
MNISSKSSAQQQKQARKRNWYLIIGAILVALITFMAIFGPSIAPQDPMQENYSLAVDGKIRTPPYKMFQVEGYPLGTDRFGRDLLSRILWGVRPTFIMVLTVAGVRLLLGIILGMATGWLEGRKGRILESLLSTALSIPVLIAAIFGIYMVGIDKGLSAFIIGLGLTGWAESARMVSEQTRAIKHQTFVEAARALGASNPRILYIHVLGQIMSMLWILLAFEISATLLVSAELGFLGYYIGGGIWIEILDFVTVNVESLPELGQMLASSLVKITDPTILLIVGSIICIGVLGFNLLGEGLRRQMSQENMRSVSRSGFLTPATEEWLEERIFRPTAIWMEENHRRIWVIGGLFSFIAGGWIIYRTVYIPPVTTKAIQFEVPGGHLWAGERGDPFGTFHVAASIDTEPQFLWKISIPGGPSGKPAVTSDGTLIITGLEKHAIAVDPHGKVLWQTQLEEIPIGTPALDANGYIFISDMKGGMTALAADGTILWRKQVTAGRIATSGPIVDANGNIYFTVVEDVYALNPQGEILWKAFAADAYLEEPPRLSLDQTMLFLKNTVIQAQTGRHIEIPIGSPDQYLFSDPTYFSGADGQNYYRLGHEIMGWRLDGRDIITDPGYTWNHGASVLYTPFEQGVTPNKLHWMFYSTSWTDSRMVWIDIQKRVIGNYRFSYPNGKFIAMGEKEEAYLCGSIDVKVLCIRIPPGAEAPTWTIGIDSHTPAIGGVLVPGRIYIAIKADGIHAFGTNQEGMP